MNDDRRIILPGDPNWDKPAAEEVAPPPKLPSDVLEAAFTEVVNDVKAAIQSGSGEIDPVEPVPVEPVPMDPAPEVSEVSSTVQADEPKITYKYHSPARQKFIDVPVPKPVRAELLVSLPKSWERKCYVGRSLGNGKYSPGFKKGEVITIIGMTFFPGIGAMYTFAEGSRHGLAVRQDQITMLSDTPPLEEQKNDTPGRQEDQVQ